MELLNKYFTNLSVNQVDNFDKLLDLYKYWNEKINVISRKDIDNFHINHLLHSLSIAKFYSFPSNTKVIDVGTGGGFPGIPLAIMFENTHFYLNDSITKKTKVVEEIVKELNLKNVTIINDRVENINSKFDYIVCRAVSRMNSFIEMIKNIIEKNKNYNLNNGIIALKGGDLKEELSEIIFKYQQIDLSNYFKESFFETKSIVYVDLCSKKKFYK